MNEYLFPCTCGQVHRITPRQAGEQLRCNCGAVLELPTMREISALERASDSTAVGPKSAWGRRQAIIFLGVLLVLVAGATWGYFRLAVLPRIDSFSISDERLEATSPVAAWQYWAILRNGMPHYPSPEMAEVVHRTQQARRGMNFGIATGLAGLALIGIGALIPKSKAK